MTMRTLAWTVLAVSLATSCEDDPDAWMQEYTFVRRGENVTLYGYELDEADACGGSFAALDTHTRSIMDFLDVDPAAQFVYRWLPPEAVERLCMAGVDACTVRGEPYATSLPYMHEMVHMVAWQLPEHGCTALLEEGLGEYLGGPRFGEPAALDHDVRELMTVRENPGSRGYARAGHFVSFLVERYGVETFRELCSSVPQVATLADWDAAIEQTLAIGLDDLLAEYAAYPACTQNQYRGRLWECEGDPDYVFDHDHRSFVVEATCADSRATNPTPGPRGDAALRRLVYFAEDMWVDVSPGAGVTFSSQQCAPCSADPQIHQKDSPSPNLLLFPAGLHEIVLIFDKQETARLRMSAQP